MEDLKEVLQTDAEDDDGLSEPKNYDEVFKERKHMGLCWKKYPSPKLYGKKIITNDVGGVFLLGSPSLEVMGSRSES